MHQPAFISTSTLETPKPWSHPRLFSFLLPHIQSGGTYYGIYPLFSASSSAPLAWVVIVPSITRVVHQPSTGSFSQPDFNPYTDPYTVARWFTSGYKRHYISLQLKLSSGFPNSVGIGQSPHVAFMPTTMCLGFLSEFAFIRPVLLLSLKCREPSHQSFCTCVFHLRHFSQMSVRLPLTSPVFAQTSL